MSDLGQSFNKLVNFMFENTNGCLVERLPENKYRWGKFVGTREEIEKAISESKTHLQNSINKTSMDFKVKMKGGYTAAMIMMGLLIFIGGALFGIGMYDETDPLPDARALPVTIIGLGLSVGVALALISTFKTLSRKEADIDIDSFTEAEINDKIEERWREIKKQVNSQK